MNVDRGRCGQPPALRGEDLQPRVVILDGDEAARVEVLELPDSVTLGASFCHCGRRWRVTGHRTGRRVLIAEPLQH